MHSRQRAIFFLTSFILFFTGNGLYPLLPHFAAGYGASATATGVFLASLSASNAVGSLLAGRLMGRFAPRTLTVMVGALGTPALLLLAQAHTLWVVVGGTALVWFVGGFIYAVLNVMTGLTAAPEERGRAFGLLFLSSPLAAIFGGGALGMVVNGMGYAPGFVALALMWTAIPLAGLKLGRGRLEEMKGEAAAPATQAGAVQRPLLGASFYLLLLSALTAAAIGARNVAAYLQMEAAGFSPAAISSTTVAAGAATVPVALYGGLLSDRIGRRTLMMATTALLALALAPLAWATALWQFAAGLALLLAATAVLRPATTAIATDLLPAAALQRGLPLIEAGMMAVGMVSAASAGLALERFGAGGVTLLSLALLGVSGVALGLLCSARLVGAVCPDPVRRVAFWS